MKGVRSPPQGGTSEQAYVLLGCDRGGGLGADPGGDNDLHELARADGLGGGAVQRLIHRDDAAEGGLRVRGEGPLVGLQQGRADGHAAGVGVLDDDAGRPLVELLDALQGRVRVADVVVGELLALDLGGGGHTGLSPIRLLASLDIEGGRLVGVLAVAHALAFAELEVEGARQSLRLLFRVLNDSPQVIGDGPVIGGGMFEGLHRQIKAGGVVHRPLVTLHLGKHPVVVAGVDYHGHRSVVLGRRTQQGGAADVDVLDGGGQIASPLGYGLLEGVEVDHHQVDGLDLVLAHHRVVHPAPPEDASVYPRGQGLDPPGHHLREAGVVRDLGDWDVLLRE